MWPLRAGPAVSMRATKAGDICFHVLFPVARSPSWHVVSPGTLQVVSYPLALVRTRLQAQSVPRPVHPHHHQLQQQHAAAAAAASGRGPQGHSHHVPHAGKPGVKHPPGHPHHLHHPPAPACSGAGGQVKYRGMVDVFRKTIRNEGVRGLYKGLLPNLLKLAPAAGIGWFVFEETKLALGVNPRS